MLLRDYCERYISSKPALRPGSADQIRIAVRSLDRWHRTPVTLDAASDALLGDWLAALSRQGREAPTVNGKRGAVLTLLRSAWRQRLIDDLPRDLVPLREPRRLPVAWTAGHVARLVAECRRQPGRIGTLPAALWWTSLVLTHYYTAPRISALLAVQLADVDLEAGWLLLRAESSKVMTDQLHSLPRPVIESLRGLWSPGRALVWPWPYHRRTIWVHFRRIVEAAGLPAPRTGRQLFYRLRRTTISLVAAQDLEAARRLAGHTTAAMTVRSYVDPRVAGASRVAEMLPDVSGNDRAVE